MHSNITYVTISILDVNDHSPKFTKEVYSFNVTEVSLCGYQINMQCLAMFGVNGFTDTFLLCLFFYLTGLLAEV